MHGNARIFALLAGLSLSLTSIAHAQDINGAIAIVREAGKVPPPEPTSIPMSQAQVDTVVQTIETARDQYLPKLELARLALEQDLTFLSDPAQRDAVRHIYFGDGMLAKILGTGVVWGGYFKYSGLPQEELFAKLIRDVRANTGFESDYSVIALRLVDIKQRQKSVNQQLDILIQHQAIIPIGFFKPEIDQQSCGEYAPIAAGKFKVGSSLMNRPNNQRISPTVIQRVLKASTITLNAANVRFMNDLKVVCRLDKRWWAASRLSQEVTYDATTHTMTLPQDLSYKGTFEVGTESGLPRQQAVITALENALKGQ